VALRPRLSPGVPLSRDRWTDLRRGSCTVKHWNVQFPRSLPSAYKLSGSGGILA
jgi:hypothetical protein